MKTINCEPNWYGVVRYFHQIDDVKYWKKILKNDDNGWFAAVASKHPNSEISKLGLKSSHYDPKKSYAGLKKGQ